MNEEELRRIVEACAESDEGLCALVRSLRESLKSKGREDLAAEFEEISSRVCPAREGEEA